MKSTSQKMFLKAGATLAAIATPENLTELLGDHEATLLPARSNRPADVVLLFVLDRADLETHLGRTKLRVSPGGALWLAYPKGTSRMKSDINRDSIREYAATLELDTVSLIAINDVWSCLRLKVVS